MINKRINSEAEGEGDKNCIRNSGISCKSDHEHLRESNAQWQEHFSKTCPEECKKGKKKGKRGEKKEKIRKKAKGNERKKEKEK